MKPAGKVVLITGARRIGAVVAETLAGLGADVSLAYNHSREDAARVVAAVERVGRRAIATPVDVSVAADCTALIETTVSALGRLDVLVNMASLYVKTPFDELAEDAVDRALAVDVRGAYLCTRAAVPHMRRAGGGRVVNFSDWIARSGRPRYPGYLPYYVAKSAIIGLTEALAFELAADGILVNAIAPGPILPPPDLGPVEVEAIAAGTPVGRWGGAAEIAKAVVALVESDFVTGEIVRVDGGRHLK